MFTSGQLVSVSDAVRRSEKTGEDSDHGAQQQRRCPDQCGRDQQISRDFPCVPPPGGFQNRGQCRHTSLTCQLSAVPGRMRCSVLRSGGLAGRAGRALQSWRTMLNNAGFTLMPPLYSMKPSLRNLFMKKLTRPRVVPTISANASWDSFGTTRCGEPSSDP